MKKRLLKPILCGVLALLILALPMLSAVKVSAAEEPPNAEKKYAIAVVYDNSGSMYNDGKDYWCQAKFAMEIFAAMLNYENGDKLMIFPMGPVTTDGDLTETRGSVDPIEIKGMDDLNVISNLYTIDGPNTPLEPVEEAQEYLDSLKEGEVDEKWLVVLTDGEFNRRKRDDIIAEYVDIEGELHTIAETEINVFYLYLGSLKDATEEYADEYNDAVTVEPDEAIGLYSEQNHDTSLNRRLVNICNTIFQRDELKGISDGKLNFGLSMRKVIVYIQGEGSKINSLTSPDGKVIKPSSDSKPRRYSEISNLKDYRGEYGKPAGVDRSLAGQVVTYRDCKAGKYTLDYELVKGGSIQVFYEPAVEIKVEVLNSDGGVVDLTKGKVNTGDYTINYSVVDSMTGEDVTDSPLLQLENFGAKLVLSDKTEIPIENGETIQFPSDGEVNLIVEGTYLKKYHITTEDYPKLFPPFEVVMPKKQKLKLEASTKQVSNWFLERDHEKWNPIILKVKLDGKALTDEQMEALKLDLSIMDDITYTWKILEGQSAYEVRIGYNEKGEYVKPAYGTYKLSAKVSMTDKYDRPIDDSDTLSFEVQPYSVVWKWLTWVLALTGIAIAIWFIGTRPILPKRVFIQFDNAERVEIKMSNKFKGCSMTLSSEAYGDIITGTAVPVSTLFKFGSTKAKFKFIKMDKPKSYIQHLSIGSKKYVLDAATGNLIEKNKQSKGEVDFGKQEYEISDMTSVSWVRYYPNSGALKTFKGRILINPKN